MHVRKVCSIGPSPWHAPQPHPPAPCMHVCAFVLHEAVFVLNVAQSELSPWRPWCSPPPPPPPLLVTGESVTLASAFSLAVRHVCAADGADDTKGSSQVARACTQPCTVPQLQPLWANATVAKVNINANNFSNMIGLGYGSSDELVEKKMSIKVPF